MRMPRLTCPAAVLMTATISPPRDAPGLVRADPYVRLNDYCTALRFYLDLPRTLVDRVIFLENSDSDLSEIRYIVESRNHGKQVELIGFQANDHPASYGKGYGEFKMIDYGLSQSTILKNSDVFWKITGRLRIRNLNRLIGTSPTSYDVYCDLRNVPFIGDLLGGNKWMDLRIFSCTVNAYDRLMRGTYSHLRKGVCPDGPEQYFYRLMRQVDDQFRVVPRFSVQPVIAGHGGHRNADYQGIEYKSKEAIRAITRKVAPWLWL